MAPIRILVADDSPRYRAVLVEGLAGEEGIEVAAAAGNVHEAVAACRAERPDVALVDVRMSGGGGSTATRMMLELSAPPRVVAHSASDESEAVVAMLEAGALSYVVKGESLAEVVAAIRHAHRGRSVLSPSAATHVVGALTGELRRGGRLDADEERRLRDRVDETLRLRLLSPVFQPIFELASGSLVGYEALTRFHGGGPVFQRFEEARRVGMEVELELHALERALEAVDRDGAGIVDDAFLSVNVSPRTACSERLLGLVEAHPHLVVEVTEHASVPDYQSLVRGLAALRERGARIAVDDVGAGYSSLRHVLQMAPDIIKMDISLTRGIDHHPGRHALGAALVSFGAEAGVTVVAEGIETERELDALIDLKVTHGQGFFLGRPAPLERQARWSDAAR